MQHPDIIFELERRAHSATANRSNGIHQDGPSCLKLALISLGILIVATVLVCAGLAWVLEIPLPVPKPYPGVVVNTVQQEVGQWGQERVQTYKADASLETLEHYYEVEMRYFCRRDIEFENSDRCREDQMQCLRAECKIPLRYQTADTVGQWFEVELYPDSGNTTRVIQITAWTD